MENLDLTLLNKENATLIHNKYQKAALPFENLFANIGFPSRSLESSNAYRNLFNFSVNPFGAGYKAGEGIHPIISNILAASINASENPSSLDGISSSKTKLRSPASLRNLMERSKNYWGGAEAASLLGAGPNFPTNHLGIPKSKMGQKITVGTWDLESTGLTPDSRVRDLSLVTREVDYNVDGTFTSTNPELVIRKQIQSDMMDIAGVTGPDGRTMPLSMATFLRENGVTTEAQMEKLYPGKLDKFKRSSVEGGKQAVEDMTEFIREMLKVDIITGNNTASFDVDMLVRTMQSYPAYNENTEAQKVLTAFLKRKQNDPGWFVDTLDSFRVFMNPREEIKNALRNVPGLVDHPEAVNLIDGLTASIMRDESLIGKQTGENALENIFLNTNIFDLIEENEEYSRTLLEYMENAGTHSSTVDSYLNNLADQLLQENRLLVSHRMPVGMTPSNLSDGAAKLFREQSGPIRSALAKINVLAENKPYSNFVSFARNRVMRSSSVTPTTNVSDIHSLSEDVFNYFKDTSGGRQKISLRVDPEYGAKIGMLRNAVDIEESFGEGTEAGELFYSKEADRFQFKNSIGRTLEVDQDIANQMITQTLEEARSGVKKGRITAGGRTLEFNEAAERINNIGFTNLEQTELSQTLIAKKSLLDIGEVKFPLGDKPATRKALSTTSEYYGAEGGISDTSFIIKNVLSSEMVPITGRMGIMSEVEKTTAYSRALASRGLPYVDIDVRSRVMATSESHATAEIGRTAYGLSGNTETAALRNKGVLENLSEMGLRHAIGQGRENQFGIKIKRATKEGFFDSAENSYFRTPIRGGIDSSPRTIMTAEDIIQLKIRKFDEAGEIIPGSEIEFGSKAFKEDINLNRLTESLVQGVDDKTINIAFSPIEQSTATMEDLADQVMSLQIKRLKTFESSETGPVAAGIIQDFENLQNSIFGTGGMSTENRRKELLKIANMATGKERETYLGELGKKNNVADQYLEGWRTVKKNLGEDIADNHIVGFKFGGGDVAERIVEGRAIHGLYMENTDQSIKGRVSRLVDITLDRTGKPVAAVLSPSVPDKVVRAAREVEAAVSKTEIPNAGILNAAQDAEVFQKSKDIGRGIQDLGPISADSGRVKEASLALNVGRDWMQANKGKILVGAAISTAAFVGYRMSKKNNENELYEDTISPAPFEQGQRPYAIQEALESGNAYSSKKRDPLMTAGIVGNLDRQKIGHTSMSSTKNNHLFGE